VGGAPDLGHLAFVQFPSITPLVQNNSTKSV
jgi:hypothetical protein